MSDNDNVLPAFDEQTQAFILSLVIACLKVTLRAREANNSRAPPPADGPESAIRRSKRLQNKWIVKDAEAPVHRHNETGRENIEGKDDHDEQGEKFEYEDKILEVDEEEFKTKKRSGTKKTGARKLIFGYKSI